MWVILFIEASEIYDVGYFNPNSDDFMSTWSFKDQIDAAHAVNYLNGGRADHYHPTQLFEKGDIAIPELDPDHLEPTKGDD